MRWYVLAVGVLASFGARAADGIAIPGHAAVVVHGPAAVAREIVATELAFEKRAEAAGPGQAMREFMDKTDGLSFGAGDPVRGAEAIYKAQGGAHGGALSWFPREVFAAEGGDMGVTWGQFRFVPPIPKPPVVTGRYVTVWRKEGGVWKGIVDIGNPD
jgi:hypothetical protein